MYIAADSTTKDDSPAVGGSVAFDDGAADRDEEVKELEELLLEHCIKTLLAPDGGERISRLEFHKPGEAVGSRATTVEMTQNKANAISRLLVDAGKPAINEISSFHQAELDWLNGGDAVAHIGLVATFFESTPRDIRLLVWRRCPDRVRLVGPDRLLELIR